MSVNQTRIGSFYVQKIDPVGLTSLEKSLHLDSLRIRELTIEDAAVLSALTHMTYLSMCQCALINLRNFPNLPNLTRLELHDNRIGSFEDLQTIASKCPKLQSLFMAGCQITDIEHIKVALSNCLVLSVLDVEINPFKTEGNLSGKDVRDQIFGAIPSLTVCNGYTRDGVKADDSEEESEEEDTNEVVEGVVDDLNESNSKYNNNENLGNGINNIATCEAINTQKMMEMNGLGHFSSNREIVVGFEDVSEEEEEEEENPSFLPQLSQPIPIQPHQMYQSGFQSQF